MFALSPIATASTALSVPPSVLATPASDLVSTRISSVAVAAPLANSAVANETANASPAPAAAANSDINAAQAAAASGTQAGSVAASGPSSTFLAQLISQNESGQEDNQIALESSFAGFAPAPSYTTFISYGIVKYRPSNAGLPSAYAPATAPSQNDNTPIANVANDYQAYSATQSRNQSNLAADSPQFVVAG